MKLCNQKLLNKSLHDKTQNEHMQFRGQYCQKNVHTESQNLDSNLAATQYNDGFHGLLKIIQVRKFIKIPLVHSRKKIKL